jgi:hypothetical protein
VLQKVERDGCPLLLESSRSRNVGVDHVIEFLRAEGREELQLSAELRLMD